MYFVEDNYGWTLAKMKEHAKYRERLITTPHLITISNQYTTINEQKEIIKHQQEFITSPAKEHLTRGICDELSRKVVQHIRNAILQTNAAKPDEMVSINIPVMDLRFNVPSTIEKQLIDKYTYKLNQNLSFGVSKRPSMGDYSTFYTFHIPSLTIQVELNK